MLQLSVRDLRHIIISQHQLCNPQLLVDPSDHDLFVDRLVRATDKVAIEVHIKIVHRMYMRERLVDKDIVHIERMHGKLQAAVP